MLHMMSGPDEGMCSKTPTHLVKHFTSPTAPQTFRSAKGARITGLLAQDDPQRMCASETLSQVVDEGTLTLIGDDGDHSQDKRAWRLVGTSERGFRLNCRSRASSCQGTRFVLPRNSDSRLQCGAIPTASITASITSISPRSPTACTQRPISYSTPPRTYFTYLHAHPAARTA
jgi:hypothetical protein